MNESGKAETKDEDEMKMDTCMSVVKTVTLMSLYISNHMSIYISSQDSHMSIYISSQDSHMSVYISSQDGHS